MINIRLLYFTAFVVSVVATVYILQAAGHPLSIDTIKSISNMIVEELKDSDPNRHSDQELKNLPYVYDKETFDPIHDSDHPWHQYVIREPSNQRACGSCASFATAHMLADRMSIKNKTKVELNPQTLLDALHEPSCDNKHANKCTCGFTASDVCQTAVDHGVGKCEEAYRASRFDVKHSVKDNESMGNCTMKPNCFYTAHHPPGSDCSAVRAKRWRFTTSEREAEEILRKTGTLVCLVAISNWFYEQQGNTDILNPPPNVGDDFGYHMICVVGVGSSYWLMRNSWGASVHKNGFFKLKKGKDALGIATNGFFYLDV